MPVPMKSPAESLSLAEARRIALRAQGFWAAPTVTGRQRCRSAARRSCDRPRADRFGNVLVRSHYLPVFSRLGPYAQELLDRATYSGRNRRLFEYWGHEASLIPGRHAAIVSLADGARNGRRRYVGWRRPLRPRVTGRSAIACLAKSAIEGRSASPSYPRAGRASRAGGNGATARWRWSGCSGPARSPRTVAGVSNGCMT